MKTIREAVQVEIIQALLLVLLLHPGNHFYILQPLLHSVQLQTLVTVGKSLVKT